MRLGRTGIPKTAGELNYWLTMYILSSLHLDTEFQFTKELYNRAMTFYNNSDKNYQAHNDVIGALYNSAKEYERRTYSKSKKLKKAVELTVDTFYKFNTIPYENKAIKRNGDVY